ncbi:hypothetical protein SNEBB_009914, partial [Seison nebaliae]
KVQIDSIALMLIPITGACLYNYFKSKNEKEKRERQKKRASNRVVVNDEPLRYQLKKDRRCWKNCNGVYIKQNVYYGENELNEMEEEDEEEDLIWGIQEIYMMIVLVFIVLMFLFVFYHRCLSPVTNHMWNHFSKWRSEL